jgi:hypothetical protein
MTEENTLPENGWAIRATKEAKKHPKWDVMLESINLSNVHMENGTWVGVDIDGDVRNGNWKMVNVPTDIITMDQWCSMTGNEITLEEQIKWMQPEFNPEKPFEVSDDGITWYPVDTSKNHYMGMGRNGNHVFQEFRDKDIVTYDDFKLIRNSFNASMLKDGEWMIAEGNQDGSGFDGSFFYRYSDTIIKMDTNSAFTTALQTKGRRVDVNITEV